MAAGLNRCSFIGNLGQDPELRYTQGGQAVLNLRLAATESYKDRDGQRKERTDWINLVVWGKRAEGLARILSKGSQIYAEGSLRTSTYDGRDGQKRSRSEVNVRDLQLLGRNPGGGRGAGSGEQRDSPNEPGDGDYRGPSDDGDDIPF